MEEKKLNDEEIVKALETCMSGKGCEVCPYFENGIDCVRRSEKDTLDLIHRLQSEIERLTEENRQIFDKIYDFIEFRQKRMVEPYKDALTYILRELKEEFGGKK